MQQANRQEILIFLKKFAGVILSLVLAFVLASSLGMMPSVFGQSNNGGETASGDNLAKTITKLVSPEGGANLSSNQSVGVSLNITGSQPAVTNNLVDMMLVLDASGSMNEIDTNSGQTKWQGLKNSVSNLVSLFEEYNEGVNLRLGATVFSSSYGTEIFTDSYGRNFTTDYNLINDYMNDDWYPVGGTNIGEALQSVSNTYTAFKNDALDRVSLTKSTDPFLVHIKDNGGGTPPPYSFNLVCTDNGLSPEPMISYTATVDGNADIQFSGSTATVLNADYKGVSEQSISGDLTGCTNVKLTNDYSDRYQASKKIVVLISDGIHNKGIDPTNDSVLNFYREDDIGIYTIGYGQQRNIPDNLVGVDINNNYAPSLWCNQSPYSNTTYKIPDPNVSGQFYCLAKNINNPLANSDGCTPDGNSSYSSDDEHYCNGVFGNRLNGLAIETNVKSYYGSNASEINNSLLGIFQENIGKTSAIEIIENFDSRFTLRPNINVTSSKHTLTLVNTLEEVKTIPNSYFVSINNNSLHIIISPNAISNTDDLTINFGFNAPVDATDNACIDTSGSRVIWGDITGSDLNGQVIEASSSTEKSLDQRCYSVTQGQGDVYFQNQPNFNLQASLAVIGGSFANITGSLAKISDYNFKSKTESEKIRFQNEMKGIADYLANEKPDKVEVVGSGATINLSDTNNKGKIFVAQDGGTITITGGNSPATALAMINVGGVIVLDNVSNFCGVLIALPNNGSGGVITANDSLVIKGSLVANSIEGESGYFMLEPFDKNNYLSQIPGLAPILDKIYSFYSF